MNTGRESCSEHQSNKDKESKIKAGESIYNPELLALQKDHKKLLEKFRSVAPEDTETREEIFKKIMETQGKITELRRNLFRKKEKI